MYNVQKKICGKGGWLFIFVKLNINTMNFTKFCIPYVVKILNLCEKPTGNRFFLIYYRANTDRVGTDNNDEIDKLIVSVLNTYFQVNSVKTKQFFSLDEYLKYMSDMNSQYYRRNLVFRFDPCGYKGRNTQSNKLPCFLYSNGFYEDIWNHEPPFYLFNKEINEMKYDQAPIAPFLL